MRLLLDSRVLLWWLDDAPRPAPVRDIVGEASAVYVSAATVWELGLKAALGKLKLPGKLSGVFADNQFDELPVTAAHAERAAQLAKLHADPFHRILVAQAEIERLTLINHGGARLRV